VFLSRGNDYIVQCIVIYIFFVSLLQLHDFAVAIRETNGVNTFLSLLDMLRIFTITNQREYIRSLLVHIHILSWAASTRSPLWEVWKTCQPALNEELCEQQLSSLARAVQGDTTGGKLEFTDKQFKLGALVNDILARNEPDRLTDERNRRAKWRKFIAEDDDDLKQVEMYFKSRIRQLRTANLFTSYTGPLSNWTTQRAASASMEHIMPSQFLIKTSSKFKAECNRVRGLVFSRWLDIDDEHWSAELDAEAPAPIVEPIQVEDLEEVLDALVEEAVPQPMDDSNILDDEPEPVEIDFKDLKRDSDDKHNDLHPTTILYPDQKVSDMPAPPQAEPEDHPPARPNARGRKKRPKPHEQSSSSSPISVETDAPQQKDRVVDGGIEPSVPPELKEIDRLLQLVADDEPDEPSAPSPRARTLRKKRRTARKPRGYFADPGEDDLWFVDERSSSS
jgi:hypothetical protein